MNAMKLQLQALQRVQVPSSWFLAGLVVVGAVVYVKTVGAKKAGQDLGAGAVNLADGAVTGVVTGIGERVGVPQTNADKCAAARAAGDTWAASFACPASDFLSYWWNK